MKTIMPLDGLRWGRDSGSAHCIMPQKCRSRTAWGGKNSVFAQSELEEVLSQMGIVQQDLVDLSDAKSIEIDEPQRAIVNFTGIESMPVTKESNLRGWLEFYDRNGHYFKKRVIMNAQGATSLGYEKRNVAIDICEDEWAGDKTTDVTIGSWVTQDAFHLKAFYIDYLKGMGEVEYKLFHQIQADRHPYWMRANVDVKGDDRALCHPDGFPCEVYLNGEFYGLFAWQLKKNRKNMNLTKDVAEHIHLDGNIRTEFILGGTINWEEFEVKNPKNLYCVETDTVNGYEYREITDNEAELAIMGDSYVDAPSNPKDMDGKDLSAESPLYYKYVTSKGKIKYYKLTELSGVTYKKYDGDYPKELIDETMPYYDANNKDHVMTAKVKAYIVRMSQYLNELHAMIDDGADENAVRIAFEERFDKESWVDYVMFHNLIMNRDGSAKNFQMFTYDGTKWMITPYDLDATYGNTSERILLPADNGIYAGTHRDPFKLFWNYYSEDIIERHKELRESGVITVENINTLINSWYDRFGAENYAREEIRWPEGYAYNDPICNKNWSFISFSYENMSEYLKTPDYSDTETYNNGDRCKLDAGIWEATGTTCGIKPYKIMRHKDTLERYLKFTELRIAYLDERFGLKNINVPDVYNLEILSDRWTTICLPIDFEIPSRLSLYSVESIPTSDVLTLTKVSSAERLRPYLVHGEPGFYLLTGKIEGNLDVSLQNGLLYGTLTEGYADVGDYVLQNREGKIGFYVVENSETVKVCANKACLKLPSSVTLKSPAYYFEETSTGISNIDNSLAQTRVGGIYTIDGVKSGTLKYGVNIVKFKDGSIKKVIINNR